jgi:protein-S-isoprenylcysteine O-methyltransferase Ste14
MDLEVMVNTNEVVFQRIAILLMVTGMSISIYFRRQAARSGDKIDTAKEEGSFILIMRSLFGLALWISTLVYLIYPRWMAWASLPLPAWARWAGAAIMAACLPFIYWLFSSLGRNVTHTVAIRKSHSLVTHGPYRWVRHPLYSVGLLLFLGLSLLAANWFIALVVLGGAPILALRTRIEEARLIERFGDEYREYMKTTGRYLPRLRGVARTAIPSYRSRG